MIATLAPGYVNAVFSQTGITLYKELKEKARTGWFMTSKFGGNQIRCARHTAECTTFCTARVTASMSYDSFPRRTHFCFIAKNPSQIPGEIPVQKSRSVGGGKAEYRPRARRA